MKQLLNATLPTKGCHNQTSALVLSATLHVASALNRAVWFSTRDNAANIPSERRFSISTLLLALIHCHVYPIQH